MIVVRTSLAVGVALPLQRCRNLRRDMMSSDGTATTQQTGSMREGQVTHHTATCQERIILVCTYVHILRTRILRWASLGFPTPQLYSRSSGAYVLASIFCSASTVCAHPAHALHAPDLSSGTTHTPPHIWYVGTHTPLPWPHVSI